MSAADQFGVRRRTLSAVEAAMFSPVECHGCRKVYDLGHVTVTARYADCDVWKAPCCGHPADSRRAWSGPSYRHMGYDDLREAARA